MLISGMRIQKDKHQDQTHLSRYLKLEQLIMSKTFSIPAILRASANGFKSLLGNNNITKMVQPIL